MTEMKFTLRGKQKQIDSFTKIELKPEVRKQIIKLLQTSYLVR